jgi:hypothetical protein
MYRGEVGVSCATRISKQVVAVLVVVAGSRVPRLKLYSEEQTLIVDLNHSDPKSFGRIVRFSQSIYFSVCVHDRFFI